MDIARPNDIMVMASNRVKLFYKGHQIWSVIFGILIGLLAVLWCCKGRAEFDRTAIQTFLVNFSMIVLVCVLPRYFLSKKGTAVCFEAYIWTAAMVLHDYVVLLMINIQYIRIVMIPGMILILIGTLGWEWRKIGTVKVGSSEMNDEILVEEKTNKKHSDKLELFEVGSSEKNHDGVNTEIMLDTNNEGILDVEKTNKENSSDKLELFGFVSYLLQLSLVTWTQYKGQQGCTPVLSDFLLFFCSALGALGVMPVSEQVLPVLHKTCAVALFIAVHTLAAEWLGEDMAYVCLPELITVLAWFTICFGESMSVSSFTSHISKLIMVSSVVPILAVLIKLNANDSNMLINLIMWLFRISLSSSAFSLFHVWLLHGWPGSSSESNTPISLLKVASIVGSSTAAILCAYMMVTDPMIMYEAISSFEHKAIAAVLPIILLTLIVLSAPCRPGQPETQTSTAENTLLKTTSSATTQEEEQTGVELPERASLPPPRFGDHITVLSIDGGGIRGLIPAVVLKRLEEKLQFVEKVEHGEENVRIADYFDVVAGTSTGALITAMLVTPGKNNRPKYTPQEIKDFYFENGFKIFPPKRWWWKGPLSMIRTSWGAKYHDTFLHKEIKRKVGLKTMADTLCKIVVPTFDVNRMEPVIFTSYRKRPTEQPAVLVEVKPGLSDICIVTSAAPTFFPAHNFETVFTDGTKDTDFHLIDGGVAANNPTMSAISRVATEQRIKNKDFHDDGVDYSRYLVISIGTGSAATKGCAKWGALGWAHNWLNGHCPIVDIFSNASAVQVDLDVAMLLHNGDPKKEQNYLRIQPQLMKDMPMDDATWENIRGLVDVGNVLMTEKVHRVDLLTGRYQVDRNPKAPTNDAELTRLALLLVQERARRIEAAAAAAEPAEAEPADTEPSEEYIT